MIVGHRLLLDVEPAKRKMSAQDERRGVLRAGRRDAGEPAVLKNSRARPIRFSTLEAMCRVLQCQPGDLLERVDD